MTDEPKKPTVHELRAMPFTVQRPWYSVEDEQSPVVTGEVMVMGTDGIEREATIDGREIYLRERLPPGVEITHWRRR